MTRRTDKAAEEAAREASEAGRILQAKQQEARAAKQAEPSPEPQAEPAPERKPEPDPNLRQPDERKVKRGNLEREAMLEEIRAKRGEPKEDPAPAAEPSPEPQAKAEPKAPAEPPAPAAEPAAQEAPKTVRVKVDGQEFDAPAEEVEAAGGVKSYQIQRASENRLRQASEQLAEAKRLVASIPSAPAKPAEPQVSDAQFIASKMDIIRFGTQEEAAAALVEIQQRSQQPKVDPDAIAQQTEARINHNIAVREFDREFADLVSNPVILQAIVGVRAQRLREHQQTNPNAPIDWGSFYRTIGNQVRSAFGRPSQPATAPAATTGTTSQPSDKDARKASIVNLPTAGARAELPKEEKPETREESLNRMRKARGQQTL